MPFTEEVLGHGWWDSDEGRRRYDRLERLREVRPVPVSRLAPTSRALDGGELEALVGTCLSEGSVTGIRDAALIVALYVGGIFAPEAASLDYGDFEQRPRRVGFLYGGVEEQRHPADRGHHEGEQGDQRR